MPAGVINLVNGAVDVVNAMLDSPDIDAISFVGSAKTAAYIYRRSAETGKRVQALGGAKNHMVVMPDAVIEPTVDGIIASAFGAAGQRCMAISAVVAVGDAGDALVAKLKQKAEEVTVGPGGGPAERRQRQPLHRPHPEPEVAAQGVGQRHGKPAVLLVDARGMHAEGIQFCVADNGVWLTDQVPPRFLTLSGAR